MLNGPNIELAVTAILAARRIVPVSRSLLVGVSGIDGCGKGYVTARLAAQVRAGGLNAANINVDGWLNLPSKRFSRSNPAQHFYEHALRLNETFQQLILPLMAKRSHVVVADFTEETADEYRYHTYRYENIDVILLEGIYLFKRAYRNHFDCRIWIECSFETALERAITRGQEGLPPRKRRTLRRHLFPGAASAF
jgi:uridine kinase